MSREWLVVVNLGSFAMIGVALVFVVLWAIDRSRVHALLFAGMIALYFAGNLVLSVHADIALLASIHGILFPIAFLLLVDGLLRRSGQQLGRTSAIAFAVILAVVVWFFAYVTPLMVGRIITQNLGGGLLLLYAALSLRASATRLADRVTVTATTVLGVSLLVNVALAPFSEVPREITTDAELDAYLASPLEIGLIVASAVLLPALLVTLLAVTIVDLVADLRYQRDRDELTGLLNRRGFIEQAHLTLKRAPVCTLILADLDFFKEVNDALGHAGGDHALATFAGVLRTAPDVGQVSGRIGGEEFAVLLPDSEARAAMEFAESIRERVAATSISYGGATTSLTASFGIATVEPLMSLPALMDAADRALYAAKAKGRNCTAVRD
ncbi:GGDEF domain-containing protein [Antrihabitans sp. YC3-6]|uniref:GGDEF domain-containing protein n=1 Tax=Antrihabitans stalagmiti TaxID=2799499 RepID=A0A934NSM8_9NOCA|nr:GGDEF domain-containing protein [Antrihabitans stalagmiti]MBJ8340751.1 GGDEF domain-containing protein [Antrihabitans stalagmiti]